MATPKKARAWYDEFYRSLLFWDAVEEMKQDTRIKTSAELVPSDVKTSIFVRCGSVDEMFKVAAEELRIGLDLSLYGLKKAKSYWNSYHFVLGERNGRQDVKV